LFFIHRWDFVQQAADNCGLVSVIERLGGDSVKTTDTVVSGQISVRRGDRPQKAMACPTRLAVEDDQQFDVGVDEFAGDVGADPAGGHDVIPARTLFAQ
jgi:hypothetical protein